MLYQANIMEGQFFSNKEYNIYPNLTKLSRLSNSLLGNQFVKKFLSHFGPKTIKTEENKTLRKFPPYKRPLIEKIHKKCKAHKRKFTFDK